MDADLRGLSAGVDRVRTSAGATAAVAGGGEVRAQLLLPESHFGCHTLSSANGTTIRVLPSGCVYSIARDGIQINQLLASPTAGGIHRIYLRTLGDSIEHLEIVGPNSRSELSASPERFVWSGVHADLHYRCTCQLHPSGEAWFFHVEVENRRQHPVKVDAILLQDVGLAARAQVRNNELYNSQYLDHSACEHEAVGHVLMTRQNLPQANDTHPWLIQGCFPEARGFATDGIAFFGVGHRGTGAPCALTRPIIGSAVRQHESGYTAIQSAEIALTGGQTSSISFFCCFDPNHAQPSSPADLARVEPIAQMCRELLATATAEPSASIERSPLPFVDAPEFAAEALDESSIAKHFPGQRRHVEVHDGALHSFFHSDDARHVVLQAKERSVLRPHGHILRSGKGMTPAAELLSCACYASGVFASQVTFGNTSLVKFTSIARDPFNLVRSSGLRILVREPSSRSWELLGTPSAFEMATDGCRWLYQRGEQTITVTASTSADAPILGFTVDARQPVEVLCSAEVAAAPVEYDHTATLVVDSAKCRLTVRPSAESLIGKKQPDVAFHMVVQDADTAAAVGGDELLFADGRSRGLPYAAVRSKPVTSFTLLLAGSDDATAAATNGHHAHRPADSRRSADTRSFWDALIADTRLSCPGSPRIAALQDTLRWYARDAVTHLATPRGLEQANGGAWGVRDVCQGPMEFLLSYGHHDLAADILLKVFAQQYTRRHDWPQWFMFRPYQEIQSTHCHGDVLIWPLKALCDYLEQTNDGELLQKRVPYTDDATFEPSATQETILQHADRVIEKMRRDFLPGLSLPRYGDGDWDDSLQPADPRLRDRMVSSWTTELMYQTLRRYAAAIARFGRADRARSIDRMADDIAADFQKFLVPDGVVAGFAVFDGEPARPVEYLLHPSDRRTGLRYRLIPMTRGMLSRIFTHEQAQKHCELIRTHLLYPDGARLMDRPTPYRGGTETVFRRAESASFFGREIGLQYVHAHLRYAEAMATLGRADELLHALMVVNPIAVTDVLTSARPRQRNCFFSSSDAAFSDRAQASRDYAKLRTGEIEVDGGWRVYSSGPGIYSNLVIRHLFGIRRHYDWVELDPVLPRELNGAACELSLGDKRVRYQFSVKHGHFGPRNVRINGITVRPTQHGDNPYRAGGFRFPVNEFEALLTLDLNVVEIDL